MVRERDHYGPQHQRNVRIVGVATQGTVKLSTFAPTAIGSDAKI